MNKEKAQRAFEKHDKNSAFLGHTKEDSDRWVKEIKQRKQDVKRSVRKTAEVKEREPVALDIGSGSV
jgi:hypothetical protein